VNGTVWAFSLSLWCWPLPDIFSCSTVTEPSLSRSVVTRPSIGLCMEPAVGVP
jgi:hypothetical protein